MKRDALFNTDYSLQEKWIARRFLTEVPNTLNSSQRMTTASLNAARHISLVLFSCGSCNTLIEIGLNEAAFYSFLWCF